MATLRGIAQLIRIDELKVESQDDKQKLTLRCSIFSKNNKQTGKNEYNNINFSSSIPFIMDKVLALGLPAGRTDPNNPIFLDIPYRQLHFTTYQGHNGFAMQGFAEIDGEISRCFPPPATANHGQGDQNDQQ